MLLEFTPMRWPDQWINPSALSLLKGTSINCLLVENESTLRPVISEAQMKGLHVIESPSLPPDITIIQGEWPGVRLSRSADRDEVSAGPTGLPWVNSNGWKVRLAAALNPRSSIWVDAVSKAPPAGSYPLCFADAAACDGRWIITLDDRLAEGINGGNREALETWGDLARATEFFAAHSAWSAYVDEAVVGVVSAFSGADEFVSHEFLNLLTRTAEQFRIIPVTRLSTSSLDGLKALVYPDASPPTPELRKQVLDFVQDGGLLIAGPKWGATPGEPANWDIPRYTCRMAGKGRIAIAKSDFADPYHLANDTVALVSHRFDLLRFWDAGAFNAYLTAAPDGKQKVVQMLFYAWEMNGKIALHGPRNATVRVAGEYRTARLLTLDHSIQLSTLRHPDSDKIGMEIGVSAVELHLPSLAHYGAIELSV